jgi:hypothetical protein
MRLNVQLGALGEVRGDVEDIEDIDAIDDVGVDEILGWSYVPVLKPLVPV